MRSSITYLYIHLIWSTWKRKAIIDPEIESILFELMKEKVIEHKSHYIVGGGTRDHIHLLVNIKPTVCISDLVKSIKGYSSYMICNHIRPGDHFKWQGGYGAFSVSRGDLDNVKMYIENQKQHHSAGQTVNDWELLLDRNQA